MLFSGLRGLSCALLGLAAALCAIPASAENSLSSRFTDQAPLQGFSFVRLFESRTITFENFPVEPVRARAEQVANQLQGQLHNPIFVVHVHRKELTPTAAVSSAPGMCIVVLNKNPDGWAVWDRFFDSQSVEQRMDMVELAVAHEIGHCVQQQELQSQSLLGSDSTATGEGTSATIDAELFADVYAGVYAQRHMGQSGLTALQTLLKVRQRFARLEPSHDTASSLQALMPQFSEVSLGLAPSPLSLKALELLSDLPTK